MSLIRLYLRKREIVVPTVAFADAGFYLDSEPVMIFKFAELDKLRQLIIAVLNEGNPKIPTPDVAHKPGSAILEKLNLKTWSSFEKESVMYTLHKGADGSCLYVTGRAADGMWLHNKDFEQKFPALATAEEIAEAVIERINWQAEIEWPEQKPKLMSGGTSAN